MLARTAKEIGLILRDQRRRLGLDQRELATRVGASRQWVIEVEKGNPGAELGRVLRALAVLNIAIDLQPQAAPKAPRRSVRLPSLDAVIERAKGARG